MFVRLEKTMRTKKGINYKNRIIYRTKSFKNRPPQRNRIERILQSYFESNFDVYNLLDDRPQYLKSTYVKLTFLICMGISIGWFCFCYNLSIRWIAELAQYVSKFGSYLIVISIALIPGFMNMYLLSSYLFDKRKTHFRPFYFPNITVLIAAYNEESCIKNTLQSISKQEYPADIDIILIDDGSNDNTIAIAQNLGLKNLHIIKENHQGKANALNKGLLYAQNEYIVTVDADTFLDKHAIYELIKKLLSCPKNTAACAGSVFVKNETQSIITQLQSWDYLLAISIIKRAQSFLNGTLVAQGAFSAYKKSVLSEVLGWPNLVGEDIVLTWAMLDKGYETTYAEKAIAFTSAPITYKLFFHQRTRWARGLIEAFIHHKKILFKKHTFVFFIYWNIFFIFIDIIRFLIFIPSIITLLFGNYMFFCPYFLILLFTSFINNAFFYLGQRKLFKSYGYYVKFNLPGFMLYTIFYQYLMNFPVIYGYYLEFFKRKKTWGTK